MDVLLNVLENVQGRENIWSLMKTCRTLYFHGMPILLRDQIWVDERDELLPLWRFLSFGFKKSNRFQYLRSLSFWHFEDDDKTISIAVKILKYAKNLEYLEFGDGIPLSSPKAFRAVAGLCRLRSVEINSSRPAQILWLQHTKSPISEVTIHDWGGGVISMSVLANLAAHLTTLDLDVDEIAMSNECFPHLRSLKLKVLGLIPASKLVSAFPNLVNLDITMHDTSYPDFPSDNEARGIHESNAADLASSSLSLPPLKFLTAHPYDLYLSGLTPKADWFGSYERLRPDGQIQTAFRKILPAIRPSVLRLSIFFEPVGLSPVPSLQSFIPFISSMTSLKMLRLELCYKSGGNAPIEHVIVRFLSHLLVQTI
ncbi:hypothetical protein NLI96_g2915 [Meripilus lineatus]|uniref:Uncharacterized protein n=1 Tax=Meripilus lineatus TaxID=2056292 RepID=A0AAD5YG60_9APHY|nr:hypothetical protein NLI96_g2915 [Physisporinus lineatus]